MQNLYKPIGLKPCSTKGHIEKKLSSLSNQEIRANIEFVLLNDTRRKKYDHAWRALTAVGELRARLGLSDSGFWKPEGLQDFRSNRKPGKQQLSSFLEKVRRRNGVHSGARTRSTAYGWIAFVAFVGTFGGLFYWISETSSRPSEDLSTSRIPSLVSPSSGMDSPSRTQDSSTVDNLPRGRSSVQREAFSERALPFPNSGSVRYFSGLPRIAPLEIQTSGPQNYLVKLENVESGKAVLDVFIRAGDTVEIEVPLGEFEIKYASGQTWYGFFHLFGPQTAYSKADTDFRFYQSGDRISGYTITLYAVSDGNLRTSRISADDF